MVDYFEYIHSEDWQKQRIKRLKIDNFACVQCGSPLNLQVHHLTYDRLGNENIETDLITLCRYCHERIEREKDNYRIKDFPRKQGSYKIPPFLLEKFFDDIEAEDKSNGGEQDFCKYDVIEKRWTRWLFENGLSILLGKDTPKLDTQAHFRDIRIKKIIELKKSGYTPKQIVDTGISQAMVYKYYNNPSEVQLILKTGKGSGSHGNHT